MPINPLHVDPDHLQLFRILRSDRYVRAEMISLMESQNRPQAGLVVHEDMNTSYGGQRCRQSRYGERRTLLVTKSR